MNRFASLNRNTFGISLAKLNFDARREVARETIQEKYRNGGERFGDTEQVSNSLKSLHGLSRVSCIRTLSCIEEGMLGGRRRVA